MKPTTLILKMSEPADQLAGWVSVGEVKSLATSGRLHACVQVRLLTVTVELSTVLLWFVAGPSFYQQHGAALRMNVKP